MAQFFYGYPFDSSKFNEEGCSSPLIRIRNLIDGKTETYFDGAFDESYIIKNGDALISEIYLAFFSSLHRKFIT